ncbi:60 kDa outer membrane protein [Rhodopirellula maiorica SM1]|uniref:60 kDa outer membrane protein n=1 Tax=Rhodopirellula maiorica SM1 TaxID=1265738 RepID=M5RKN7_9BACT|nr:DUF11 domain-containing protein [Rhodopirellula maiorica]EMI19756.1 60 kDa outer membrane protein [Rhodopirellula maiorica SM1]
MSRWLKTTPLFTMLVAAVIGIGPSLAQADETITTGDGLLTLRASMPEETRVGESFTYTVEVTNASDNIVLHDIELKQRKAKGLSIESVSVKGADAKNQNKDKAKKTTSEKTSKSSDSMNIAMLNPGQSKTLEVTASADEEGELRSCLEISSYTPALCLSSKVVKPQLELTKNAPEKVNRCDVIELEYAVKNGGTGDVGPFVVSDSLGDGLATIEGNSELEFQVDGLKAGDTRKFVARVYAQKSGTFSSRAEAKAENSDLSSRSKETSTEVITADLAVNLDGPNRLYGDQMAEFTASITNTGNAVAEDVQVRVLWPNKSRLLDMSDTSIAKQDKQSKNNQANKGEPTPAKNKADKNKSDKKNKDKSANNDKAKNQKSGNQQSDKNGKDQKIAMEMNEDTITIDRLEAGQTATFDYAVRAGDDVDKLPTKVVATYVCAVDAAEDQAKAEARATSMAMVEAKIVRLPAMQMLVIDDEDPVSNGGEVAYMIRVWNEGDAADNKVKVVAELPEGLTFQSAEGPTKHSQDGSSITFEPIKTMKPGERMDYKVIAKADGNENVLFKATLTSEKLSQEVTTEEPTRLFSRQAKK